MGKKESKALMLHDMGQVEDAEKCTAEAIDLSPDFVEAYYQNAQYNAQLGKVSKTITSLEKAIKKDKNYCLKAGNDLMFDPIRKDVNSLFVRLKDDANNSAISLQRKLEDLIVKINKLLKEPTVASGSFSVDNFNPDLTKIKNVIKRDSYFDGLESKEELSSLNDKVGRYVSNIRKFLGNLKSKIDSEIRDKPERDTASKREALADNMKYRIAIWVSSVVLLFFLGAITNETALGFSVVCILLGGLFFWGGGYVFSIMILRVIGNILYSEADYSQFVFKKRKEKESIDALFNKFQELTKEYSP